MAEDPTSIPGIRADDKGLKRASKGKRSKSDKVLDMLGALGGESVRATKPKKR